MEVNCPYCGAAYKVELDELGKNSNCEVCGKAFLIGQTDRQTDTVKQTPQASKSSIGELVGCAIMFAVVHAIHVACGWKWSYCPVCAITCDITYAILYLFIAIGLAIGRMKIIVITIVVFLFIKGFKGCNEMRSESEIKARERIVYRKELANNFIFLKTHGVGLSIRRLPGLDFKLQSTKNFFADVARDEAFGSLFSREEVSDELASTSHNCYIAKFKKGNNVMLFSSDISEVLSDELPTSHKSTPQEIKELMDAITSVTKKMLEEECARLDEAMNKKLKSGKHIHTEVKIVERVGNTVVFCCKNDIYRQYHKYILDIKNRRRLHVVATIFAGVSAQDKNTIKSCVDSAHLFDEDET